MLTCRSHVFNFSCPTALNWEWASRRRSRYTLLHRLKGHTHVCIQWCNVGSQFYRMISNPRYRIRWTSVLFDLRSNFKINSFAGGPLCNISQIFTHQNSNLHSKSGSNLMQYKLKSGFRCFSQSQRHSWLPRQISITSCNHSTAKLGIVSCNRGSSSVDTELAVGERLASFFGAILHKLGLARTSISAWFLALGKISWQCTIQDVEKYSDDFLYSGMSLMESHEPDVQTIQTES